MSLIKISQKLNQIALFSFFFHTCIFFKGEAANIQVLSEELRGPNGVVFDCRINSRNLRTKHENNGRINPLFEGSRQERSPLSGLLNTRKYEVWVKDVFDSSIEPYTDYQRSKQINTISIHGEIKLLDSFKLKQALKKVKPFEHADGNKYVFVIITSPGGVYFEGVRMQNALREYKKENDCYIVTVAMGPGALSAGALIWLGGDCLMICDESVVGFHAPYHEKDKTTSNEIIMDMQTVVNDRLGGVKPDLSEALNEYISLIFEKYGPDGWLILNSKFDLNMWEEEDLESYLSKSCLWAEKLNSPFIELIQPAGEYLISDKTTSDPIRFNLWGIAPRGITTDTSKDIHNSWMVPIPPNTFLDWKSKNHLMHPFRDFGKWIVPRLNASYWEQNGYKSGVYNHRIELSVADWLNSR